MPRAHGSLSISHEKYMWFFVSHCSFSLYQQLLYVMHLPIISKVVSVALVPFYDSPSVNDKWVRSRRWACIIIRFCYHLIAKPGNETDAPSWPDLYSVTVTVNIWLLPIKLHVVGYATWLKRLHWHSDLNDQNEPFRRGNSLNAIITKKTKVEIQILYKYHTFI